MGIPSYLTKRPKQCTVTAGVPEVAVIYTLLCNFKYNRVHVFPGSKEAVIIGVENDLIVMYSAMCS